jgi:hypothetical protein
MITKQMIDGTMDYDVSTSVYDDYAGTYKRSIEESDEFENSTLYRLCAFAAKLFDDYYLDAILGAIIPGIGDAVCSLAIVPSLFTAMFKLKSLRLTLAILQVWLLDLVVGSLPVAGDLIDASYKSNKIAFRLVVGYHKRDSEVMKEINRRCSYFLLTCAAACFAVV